MLLQSLLKPCAIDMKAADEIRIEERGTGKAVECAPQPFLVRDTEPRLRRIEYVVRKSPAQRLAEHNFLLGTADFIGRRQSDRQRGNSFIEERHSSLNAVRHRRAVDFRQELRG